MAKNLTRDFMYKKGIHISHSASEIKDLLKHNPTRNTNAISYEHDYHSITAENTIDCISHLLIDR